MNNWVEHDLSGKITDILRDAPFRADAPHLGRPYLTPYQIAIALAERHPQAVESLEYPIGGLGTGQQTSLAQYVAQNLSREIKAGRLPEIEGGFLSNEYLNDVSFRFGDEIIHSSLTGGQDDLSTYRLR